MKLWYHKSFLWCRRRWGLEFGCVQRGDGDDGCDVGVGGFHQDVDGGHDEHHDQGDDFVGHALLGEEVVGKKASAGALADVALDFVDEIVRCKFEGDFSDNLHDAFELFVRAFEVGILRQAFFEGGEFGRVEFAIEPGVEEGVLFVEEVFVWLVCVGHGDIHRNLPWFWARAWGLVDGSGDVAGVDVFFECDACAKQSAFDGSFVEFDDFGDFFVAQVFNVAQDQDQAEVFAELEESFLDDGFEFVADGLTIGSGDGGAERAFAESGVFGFIDASVQVVRAPGQVLQAVLGAIDRDTVEPCGEFRFTAKGIDVFENGNKHFLGKVFGFFAIAHDAQTDIEDFVLVGEDAFGEGVFVAGF